jgi:ABC-type sugar transport system permease subunit
MFKYFVEGAVPELFNLKFGLLGNANTKLGTIIFYNVWIGFGTQVLMYSGAMSGIDPSIMEAARLDGASPIREFFSVILPLIFPTVQTFLVTGVATILINQINLVAFDGLWASPQYITVGYYLFSKAEAATNYELPVLATYGVCLTLIAAPLTLLTRWALDKFGPSVE